eukprot:g14244.t1
MHYIEGGWPGSNPKDVEFFERARTELPSEAWAKVVAFGSTRRKFKTCDEDTQLESLISAGTGCVTIVAKAWDLHVDHILEVPREENLAMVRESVAHLKSAGKEVMLDLEHFFDGWKANSEYTMQVCEAAVEAKVDVLVLCDTNGGSLPWEVDEVVRDVQAAYPGVRLGIHCHNDAGLAVANSLQAVRSGVDVVQGTVNGIGERTGNANLMTIIPTLQLKMGVKGVGEHLTNLTTLSRFTDEQFNMASVSGAPYTGISAFAHKGGIHVSAVNKIPDSYQHIDPDRVGNKKRVLVSELSGQSNILSKVEDSGMASKSELKASKVWRERLGQVLKTVKRLETQGYSYEGADASVNLLVRRTMRGYVPPFKLRDYLVQIWDSDKNSGGLDFQSGPRTARATVKVRVPSIESQPPIGIEEEDPGVRLEVAEGNGPVDALAKALFRALLPSFPSLESVVLSDYKVRILDQESATRAKTRVLIEFYDKVSDVGWSTVGVNTNIISASMSALMDGFEYALVEFGQSCSIDAGPLISEGEMSIVTGTTKGSNGGARAPGGDGPVDISNWNMYGRSTSGRPVVWLVGPVVGTCTESSARILVEMDKTAMVTMDAFMDGRKVCSVSKEVRRRTPTALKLKNFRAGKRIRVVVSVGEFGQEREARFTTPSDKTLWKIAAVSCNCHTHIDKLSLWNRLSTVVGDVDCVLHLGDQIYADEDYGAKHGESMRFDSAWQECLTILEGVDRSEWDRRRPELLECYRKTYRKTWNFPYVATVLASTANYMICDDHEFVDDLGDEPEHSDKTTPDFYVARVGYQAYCEYQKQLLTEIDPTDHRLRAFYAFRLSSKVGFFMTDNRVERSLHRYEDGVTEADWKDREFLGPKQWARLEQAFSTDFADCETVLFGAPTPLVFISQAATGVAEKIIDDARGTWGHKKFMREQKAMTGLLSDWQMAKPNRAVVTLAGDVHIGGFTDSWHNNSRVPLHQMTASAVGNTPERDLDMVKEGILRGVMHADEHMFEFKVRHHGWIFGPNYGMLDIQVATGGRPEIAMTLVPHMGDPKIRNLELGNSKISVTDANHSDASRAAHATAKIMGVTPEGMPTASPGCNGDHFEPDRS